MQASLKRGEFFIQPSLLLEEMMTFSTETVLIGLANPFSSEAKLRRSHFAICFSV